MNNKESFLEYHLRLLKEWILIPKLKNKVNFSYVCFDFGIISF